jgi:hypothetical protein
MKSRLTSKTGQLDRAFIPALESLIQEIANEVSQYQTYADVPDNMKGNIRNYVSGQ